MSKESRDPAGHMGPNPGYAAWQLSQALQTADMHADTATRERAARRAVKWSAVLAQMQSGEAKYGSRQPFAKVPIWATGEVVKGGFATGGVLSAGPLRDHEIELLADLRQQGIETGQPGQERAVLCAYFLTDAGLAQLRHWLRSGCYDITVPEEGVLLTIAWLLEQGLEEDAYRLVDKVVLEEPWMRFYPVPLSKPRNQGAHIHIQNAGETLKRLNAIRPRARLVAQRNSATIWMPLYDRTIALFIETKGDSPGLTFPVGWQVRARTLLEEWLVQEMSHTIPHRRMRGSLGHIRRALSICAENPSALGERGEGMVRAVLLGYIGKRGIPDSEICRQERVRQRFAARLPWHSEVAPIIARRLNGCDQEDGIEMPDQLLGPISDEEASASVPVNYPIPSSIQNKVWRAVSDTAEELAVRGLITSGEVLATVLPQLTAGVRAAGLTDPSLRRLYAGVYRAFRRRRSLLLLNLEKQVQLHELPWVATIERQRQASMADREVARQALDDVTQLALRSFPQALLPNKLLQEIGALAGAAGLSVPLTEELAADIFMGQYTAKFVAAAHIAGKLLRGTLYARYYAIDETLLLALPTTSSNDNLEDRARVSEQTQRSTDAFAALCRERAGTGRGTARYVVANGMCIEQQQILTTHNLAVLHVGLGLQATLGMDYFDMAQRCFSWICDHMGGAPLPWRAALKRFKNSAYAWRQMLFYLSLETTNRQHEFIDFARDHLRRSKPSFQERFAPMMEGLVRTIEGSIPSVDQRFLGWVNGGHPLLNEMCGK